MSRQPGRGSSTSWQTKLPLRLNGASLERPALTLVVAFNLVQVGLGLNSNVLVLAVISTIAGFGDSRFATSLRSLENLLARA